MKVVGFDHLVLTVASTEAAVAFYRDVLAMTVEVFGPERRTALRFAGHKINLHEAGKEFEPKARRPVPGSADLCLIVDDLEACARHLSRHGVPIEQGPVARTGVLGPFRSLYVRDPDGNLVELSTYPSGTGA